MDILKKTTQTSFAASAILAGLGGGILGVTNWTWLGSAMAISSLIPMIRALVFSYKTKKIVSSVWISPDLEKLDIIYGT